MSTVSSTNKKDRLSPDSDTYKQIEHLTLQKYFPSFYHDFEQNLQTIETLTKQLAITTTDKDAIQTENEQLKVEINSLKELLLDQQKTCRE